MKSISVLILACLSALSPSIGQTSQKPVGKFTIQYADSLFLGSFYSDAIPAYEAVLRNAPDNGLAWNRLAFSYHTTGNLEKALANYARSLEHKPSPQLEMTVRSRMARVYSLRNDKENAFANLDKALILGYALVGELETHADYNNLRNDSRFDGIVQRATRNAFPCMDIPQAREFDFWVGEWDVYPNGAATLVGHSKIEMAAGGCMILENWTAVGPMPHTGKSMNYINSVTGKWEQFWIGSGGLTVSNPQKFVNGEYRDGAMRFEFEQTGRSGQKQIGRFIFFNEGPDQVRQFNEVSTDGGKTWTTVYDFVYKRKK